MNALGPLERARELARQDRPTPPQCTRESTTQGGGDKGDKSEKPPSTPQERASARVPVPDIQADDPEVAWRAEAMWLLIQPGSPIPFLVARDVSVVEGTCLSCGDALEEGERYRCSTCLKAAILVLASRQKYLREDGAPR